MLSTHPNKYLLDLLCETAPASPHDGYVPESFREQKIGVLSCALVRESGRHAASKAARFFKFTTNLIMNFTQVPYSFSRYAARARRAIARFVLDI